MTSPIAERIQARLDALGKNPSSVALEAGLGRSSVRDILLGRASSPRIDTLRKLTGPLDCTLGFLTGVSDDPSAEGDKSLLWWMDAAGFAGIERLEAGVFRPRKSPRMTPDPRTSTPPDKVYVAYRDPRLLEWSVRAYEVADNTMEDVGIYEGDVLTVAHHPQNIQIPLTDGLIVVSRRFFIEVNAEELSVRQIELGNEFIQLNSRSKTGADPIILLGWDLSDKSKTFANRYAVVGGSVWVEGVVVRVTRQLPISEEMTAITRGKLTYD